MENTVYLYQAAVNKGDISVNIDWMLASLEKTVGYRITKSTMPLKIRVQSFLEVSPTPDCYVSRKLIEIMKHP
jgi:hypothetical protein